MMKKEYINPEMDIYEIKMGTQLMAGSELGKNNNDDDAVTDEGDILAPGLLFSVME